MAYINVNHSKFAAAASKVQQHADDLKKNMRSANAQVNGLASSWQGADASRFINQWNRVDDSDSTYAHMVAALESYSDFLEYAAKKYKEAQTSAVNRANRLPRW